MYTSTEVTKRDCRSIKTIQEAGLELSLAVLMYDEVKDIMSNSFENISHSNNGLQ